MSIILLFVDFSAPCTIYVTGPCEVVLDGMVIIIFSVFVDDGMGINPMAHKLGFYIHPYFLLIFFRSG